MFEAAKYATASWFPQQLLEIARIFQHAKALDFAGRDAREGVSPYLAAPVCQAARHPATHKNLPAATTDTGRT